MPGAVAADEASRRCGSRAGTINPGPARLAPDGEHYSETRLSAHHAVVHFGGALQREGFRPRPHATARTEGERCLGVDRRSGIPALDRTAPREQHEGGYPHAGAAPVTTNVPLTARPPWTALMASPLVVVAGMTLAPPNLRSPDAGSCA